MSNWTMWLSKTDIRRINRELRRNGLTELRPDANATGAYLINVLERLPAQERASALRAVHAVKGGKR